MAINQDISSRADIEMIVQTFYASAIDDPEIGYIFTDVAHLDLSVHLPVIVDFWESVLFGVGKYKGNPILKHIHLHSLSALEAKHFERWLDLWCSTIVGRYAGVKADETMAKAKMMAQLMQYKIKASEGEGFVQ